MIPRERFARIRAKILDARDKRAAFDSDLQVKYGSGYSREWCSKGEQAQLLKNTRTYSRECDRMFALLDASPRNWREGVPAFWIAESLTYEDAIRPRTEPLSVTPPPAYGYTRSIS